MLKKKFLSLVALFAVLLLSACQLDAPPETKEEFVAQGVPSVVDRTTNRDIPDFKALASMLEKDPASVVPPEALDLVGGAEELRASIPKGTKYEVLEDTWQPDGAGGTVRIVMNYEDGSKVESLALMLQDASQRWFVLQTIPEDQIPEGLGAPVNE